ncbi:MAG: OmpA family protein [Fibromonadaceae bacterium]|jgi:outer membrane protein OmpA-like peptidoglycan-associated protein|nr:OmpA family protein [Fibromonadaceae bacterium]
MNYSSNSLKSKIFALFLATFVLSTHAGEGNLNFYGQRGVHKTQSAQTLGHGRFGLGLLLEGAKSLNSLIEDENSGFRENGNSNPYGISEYFGGNVYTLLSFGISNYFDASISFPVYLEQLQVENVDGSQDAGAAGWGDVFISTKWSVPFDDNYPFNLAGLVGFGISTGTRHGYDLGKTNTYGPWIRDPMFVRLENRSLNPQWPYSTQNYFGRFGLAASFDFDKTKAEVPIMIHINGTNRQVFGTDGGDYPNVWSFSTALEWTPVEFISGFVEYYRDIPINGPDESTNLSTFSFGTAFHLGKSLDLQFGTQLFIGDKDKYTDELHINLSDKAYYSARLIPDYLIFGGIIGKIYTAEPKKEVKPEYRNPDTDGDKLCDPWVSETGKQQEFANTCKGIDLCPYESGPKENKGCPVQEVKVEAVPAPIILFTATPDVVQKGNSVTLTWQVTNATSVSIDGVGEVQASGTRKMKPTENTVYKLTAVGEGGTQTATADVEIAAGPLPIILFTASSESVQIGQPVTLKWQVTNATEVNISGGVGKVQLKGSKQLKPTETATYTLTAVGEGGTQTEAITVEITAAPVIEARVNLQGVTFGSGNATLTANAKKILDGVAEQLLANPKVKIEIQGHTDNVGNPRANQDLSERRAKAVVGYLATKGVKMTRMRAVGYGQDVPIADNATADGRELNRRIEMVRVDD